MKIKFACMSLWVWVAAPDEDDGAKYIFECT